MRQRLSRHAGIAALLLALAAVAGSARAEQFRSFGDYEVHYNAVRSDFIAPEAAAQHGLTRSATRGLLNVAVLRRADDGTQVHSEATLAVTVRGSESAGRTIRMRPIREPGVLYYIGEFRIAGADTWQFELAVQPADSAETFNIRFSQLLLAD
jgi:hypothetical protein